MYGWQAVSIRKEEDHKVQCNLVSWVGMKLPNYENIYEMANLPLGDLNERQGKFIGNIPFVLLGIR